MQINNNLTIFNPRVIEHNTVYYGCKIWNVWAIYRARIDLDINTEFNTSKLIARIPIAQSVFSKQYVEPLEYEASDPSRYFTFIPGSIAVLGIVDAETATKDWLLKNCTAVQITKVNDNRLGLLPNKHWKLEGV